MSWPVELLNASNRSLRRKIDALSQAQNEQRAITAAQRDQCAQLHATLRLTREQTRTMQRILTREDQALRQRQENLTRVKQELPGLRQTARELPRTLAALRQAWHAIRQQRGERAALLTRIDACRATREQEVQELVRVGLERQAYAATLHTRATRTTAVHETPVDEGAKGATAATSAAAAAGHRFGAPNEPAGKPSNAANQAVTLATLWRRLAQLQSALTRAQSDMQQQRAAHSHAEAGLHDMRARLHALRQEHQSSVTALRQVHAHRRASEDAWSIVAAAAQAMHSALEERQSTRCTLAHEWSALSAHTAQQQRALMERQSELSRQQALTTSAQESLVHLRHGVRVTHAAARATQQQHRALLVTQQEVTEKLQLRQSEASEAHGAAVLARQHARAVTFKPSIIPSHAPNSAVIGVVSPLAPSLAGASAAPNRHAAASPAAAGVPISLPALTRMLTTLQERSSQRHSTLSRAHSRLAQSLGELVSQGKVSERQAARLAAMQERAREVERALTAMRERVTDAKGQKTAMQQRVRGARMGLFAARRAAILRLAQMDRNIRRIVDMGEGKDDMHVNHNSGRGDDNTGDAYTRSSNASSMQNMYDTAQSSTNASRALIASLQAQRQRVDQQGTQLRHELDDIRRTLTHTQRQNSAAAEALAHTEDNIRRFLLPELSTLQRERDSSHRVLRQAQWTAQEQLGLTTMLHSALQQHRQHAMAAVEVKAYAAHEMQRVLNDRNNDVTAAKALLRAEQMDWQRGGWAARRVSACRRREQIRQRYVDLTSALMRQTIQMEDEMLNADYQCRSSNSKDANSMACLHHVMPSVRASEISQYVDGNTSANTDDLAMRVQPEVWHARVLLQRSCVREQLLTRGDYLDGRLVALERETATLRQMYRALAGGEGGCERNSASHVATEQTSVLTSGRVPHTKRTTAEQPQGSKNSTHASSVGRVRVCRATAAAAVAGRSLDTALLREEVALQRGALERLGVCRETARVRMQQLTSQLRALQQVVPQKRQQLRRLRERSAATTGVPV